MANETKTQKQAIREAIKENKIEARNLKTFVGMEECGGFNVDIYADGKKWCEARNDDSGGETNIHYEGNFARVMFERICQSMPIDNEFDIPIACTPDIFIDEVVNLARENRDFKRKCAKNVLYRLKTDGDDIYHIISNQPFTKEFAEKTRKHFGDNLLEIINERFGAPVDIKDHTMNLSLNKVRVVQCLGKKLDNLARDPDPGARSVIEEVFKCQVCSDNKYCKKIEKAICL